MPTAMTDHVERKLLALVSGGGDEDVVGEDEDEILSLLQRHRAFARTKRPVADAPSEGLSSAVVDAYRSIYNIMVYIRVPWSTLTGLYKVYIRSIYSIMVYI